MAGDVVAEVDGPGEGGGCAVGLVGEAGEEAADASDGDGDGEGVDPGVAGALGGAGEFFGDFDADPTAHEASDDGLAVEPRIDAGDGGLGFMSAEAFSPGEQFGPDKSAADRADDGPEPAFKVAHTVLRLNAGLDGQMRGEADGVGDALHHAVRMHGHAKEVKVIRKLHPGPFSGASCLLRREVLYRFLKIQVVGGGPMRVSCLLHVVGFAFISDTRGFMGMRRSWALAAILLLGLLAPARAAGPLDSRVPADALFYLGWQGADDLAKEYGQSNLKAVIDNSKLAGYLVENWPLWMAKAQQGDADAAKKMDDVMGGLTLLWRHTTAVYAGPVGFADPKKPSMKFAAALRSGRGCGGFGRLGQAACWPMIRHRKMPRRRLPASARWSF